jgi:hypothetical protein
MRLVTVMTVVVAALAAGCANQTPEGGTVAEQRATLAARPTIDEITARYERMQAELRQRLVAEIGISEWAKDSELSGSGCADFPNMGGESRSLGTWSSEGNLPDDRWPQAQAIVTEVTGRYGFAPPEIIVDRPREHTIIGGDQYGASYDFGTGNNTVLGVSTGCHRNPPGSPPP